MSGTRLAKIRTMSAREVGGRIADWATSRVERFTARPQPLWIDTGSPRSTERIAHYDFFPSLRDANKLVSVLRSHYGPQVAATLKRADALLANQFEIFGHVYLLESDVDWHRDPKSTKRWPHIHRADVLRVGANGADVKHVWELNRHQFLVDLARAWLLTGERRYVDAIIRLVRGWCEQNPGGFGVNWAGPLEVAYRALSWVWAYAMVGVALAPSDSARWSEALRVHARYLYRNLERYASPYNHLIGEAAVLFILGIVGGDSQEALRWRARGRRTLESSVSQQFYPDGGSVEQATGYHNATLGFYLLAALLGRVHGEEFSASVWDAVERALEFSMHLTQPDGMQPAIGDNDDARPIRFELQSGWDFRHLHSLGAVVFRRADFKFIAERFHEDGLWLLGPEGWAAFDALSGQKPAETSRAFRNSGYVVLRSAWTPDADYVCFDVGEQAGGLRTDGVPSAAHGHADCLSITACLGGRPVLVDAGFYTYNGDRRWERYFRETLAHNTVRIDHRDQATHLDSMAWCHIPKAMLEDCELEESRGFVWARGSHDGYSRGTTGVIHRRTVVLRPGAGLLIFDDLSGAGTHEAEVAFQLPGGSTVSVHGDAAHVDSRTTLRFAASAPFRVSTANVDEARSQPPTGMIAPALDHLVAAPRVIVVASFQARCRILTVVGRSGQLKDLLWTHGWPQDLRRETFDLVEDLWSDGVDRSLSRVEAEADRRDAPGRAHEIS